MNTSLRPPGPCEAITRIGLVGIVLRRSRKRSDNKQQQGENAKSGAWHSSRCLVVFWRNNAGAAKPRQADTRGCGVMAAPGCGPARCHDLFLRIGGRRLAPAVGVWL